MRLHPVLATLAFAGALHAQGVIAPNDNLVVDGIPPVPARIAETARPYTESRAVTLWDWAPRAHAMLIGTRFGETVQAHAVAMAMGERRQLTFFPDRVQEAVYEPTAGRYLVVARDAGGNEFTQLYRFDLATGSATLITDGGRSQNGIGPWSRDGKRIAYASTRRDGTDRDLYVMDPADPGTDRLVAKVTGSWQPLDWSPDGTSLLAMQFVSVNESYLWLVDVATGAMTALTPKGAELVAYDRGAFAADGKGIYTVTDLGSDVARLAYLDLATKRVTPVTKASWDVEAFALSRDGRTIAYVTNEDGISKLHLMRAGTHAALPAPKVPVGVIGDLRWHPDGTLLGFTVNSARAPSDAYVLDVKRGSVARWTASETGGLDLSAMPEPELVRWKTWDGRMLSGFLYRPPARFTGKRPVIVNIHGGPEGQSRPTFRGAMAYFTEEMGITVIEPNVRGSTGYGKKYTLLDNGMKRQDSVHDIGALLDWVGEQPDLDNGRVVVTGGSYGGFMTLSVATQYDARIRCTVEVVGISNLRTFLEHTSGYRRDLRRVEYGDEREPAMREFMEKTAPMNMTQNVTKPMFMIVGYNDPRVPISESIQFKEKLEAQHTPVWFLMAKDEGHGYAKKPNRDFQLYATIAFLEANLLEAAK